MNFNGKVILYGAGKVMLQTKKVLENVNFVPSAILDKNPLRWGEKIEFGNSEIIIGKPEELEKYDCKDNVIILTVGRKLYHEVYTEVREKIKNAALIYHQIVIYEIAKMEYKNRKVNWEINYEEAVEQWISLLEDEIYHHKLVIKQNENCDSSMWVRQEEIPRLHNYPIKENAVVLDIGAGSLLKYCSIINGTKVNYVPVDVLKYSYDYLREKYSFRVPYETRFAFAEHLSLFYPAGDADYIIFDNSLDHTINPLRCLIEAFCVVSDDGVVSLKHLAVEAKMGVAEGLHQWDFLLTSEKEFVIANKDNFINVSRLFEPYAEIEAYEEYDDIYCTTAVVVNIKKKAELDEVIIEKYDSKTEAGILLSVLFRSITKLNLYFDEEK